MDTYAFMYTLSFVVFYFINAAYPNEVHTGHNTDAAVKFDISDLNEISVQITQLKEPKEPNESEQNNQKNLSSEIQTPVTYHDEDRRMNKPGSMTESQKTWVKQSSTKTKLAGCEKGDQFSAYLSKILYPISPGHVIKCDRVILNDGHGYNPYTGVFTAPQSGVYLLTYHLASIKSTHIKLVSNGRVISNAVTDPSASFEEEMGGNTIIVGASVGQSIWLESYQDLAGEIRYTSGHRFTTLSGYLLY